MHISSIKIIRILGLGYRGPNTIMSFRSHSFIPPLFTTNTILIIIILLHLQHTNQLSPSIPFPSRLYKTSCPSSPLMRMNPKRMPQLLIMHLPKPLRDKFQILRGKRVRFNLSYWRDCTRGQRKRAHCPRVQRPRQQLLTTKIPRPNPALIPKTRPPAIRSIGIKIPMHDE